MTLLPTNETFSSLSGIVNTSFLEGIYHSFIDESFEKFSRIITLHLEPQIEQDNITQSKSQAGQYNPFFGRVPVPQTNTRNTGTKITPRDVQYHAQIRLGPQLKLGKEANDTLGIGYLNSNQAVVTLTVDALPHLYQTRVISIEGRRYSIDVIRTIGFSIRRYAMITLTQIQETDVIDPTLENTFGA